VKSSMMLRTRTQSLGSAIVGGCIDQPVVILEPLSDIVEITSSGRGWLAQELRFAYLPIRRLTKRVISSAEAQRIFVC
jgi:hypothetical protein